jgi:predicted nucleic acid-binding protein
LSSGGSGFLLDTNVIAHLINRKKMSDSGVIQFFERVAEERLFLSVLTIGEIHKGIALLRFNPDRGHKQRESLLDAQLAKLVARFDDHILQIDVGIARAWGELSAWRQSNGKPASAIDALIAATASVHDLIVVTGDQGFRAFEPLVSIYDPWHDVPVT